MAPIRFTIYGQAASKANSRRIVPFGDKARSIKSKEALDFERDALRQIPPACRVRLQGPVAVTMRIFYRTERPDLDESIVLDCLQDRFKILKLPNGRLRRELMQPGVITNDRLVREKHIYHGIDAKEPRVEIEITSIAPTDDLFAPVPHEAPIPF